VGVLEDFDAGRALIGFENGGVAAEARAKEPMVFEHGAGITPHIHAHFSGPVLEGEFTENRLVKFWHEGDEQ
jgi:hypothetical protein